MGIVERHNLSDKSRAVLRTEACKLLEIIAESHMQDIVKKKFISWKLFTLYKSVESQAEQFIKLYGARRMYLIFHQNDKRFLYKGYTALKNNYLFYKNLILEENTIIIQRYWREYLRIQVQYAEYMIRCSIKLQSIYRGYRGRLIYKQLKYEQKKIISALTMECAYRSYKARKYYKKLYTERLEYIMSCRIRLEWRLYMRKVNKALYIIHSAWLGHHFKKLRRERMAAIRCQKYIRSIYIYLI